MQTHMQKKIQRNNKDFKWDKKELQVFQSFKAPMDIQLFLNKLKYNTDGDICKSPRKVLRIKTAHCTEGAYFAAAALRFMGYPPLIVDFMVKNDDEHLIAVFKKNDLWGAVAKSNTTSLRYRDPVYKSIRELVMSFFEFYFNILGVKSLRSYSRPINLSQFDCKDWMYTDEELHFISDYLTQAKHKPIASEKILDNLAKTDKDVFKAVFLTSDWKGLYKAKKEKE